MPSHLLSLVYILYCSLKKVKIVKKSEKNTKIPQKNGKKYIIVMNTYKYIKLYLKQNNILNKKKGK